MKIVITGSRHWSDKETIREVIKSLASKRHSIGDELVVIHGGARGVDTMAGEAADEFADEVIVETPAWNARGFYNPNAGFERNEKMLDEYDPDHVIAFRAVGKSNGTDQCIKEARKRDIRVTIISEDGLDNLPEEITV